MQRARDQALIKSDNQQLATRKILDTAHEMAKVSHRLAAAKTEDPSKGHAP